MYQYLAVAAALILLTIVIVLQAAEIRRLKLWLDMLDEYDVSEQKNNERKHWMDEEDEVRNR